MNIIYKSQRIGKNGKVFIMYKFRTLKENTDKTNSFVSEDQNTTGYVSFKDLNQKKEILEKVSIKKAPKEKKMKGMLEVNEDAKIDRRFLTKAEKKVL